jgi:preprotein translocase subunit SecA
MKGALRAYEAKRQELTAGATDNGGDPEEMVAQAHKYVMLQAIDQLWVRHLTDLDMLREGIGLQAIRQRDPLVEYKIEGFRMWEALQEEISGFTVRNIFRIALVRQQAQQVSNIREGRADIATSAGNGSGKPEPVRASAKEKVGRNDPCWCGRGKKYKHCHYRQDQRDRDLVRNR